MTHNPSAALIVSFVKLAVLTFFSFVMFETMQILMDGGTL